MARPKLSNIPTETLVKELARREAKLEQLKAERARLDKEIAQFENVAGGAKVAAAKPAPARRGGRPRKAARPTRGGGKPLSQYLKDVLAGKPGGMDLKLIEQAVKDAGYPTTAKTLYNPILKIMRGDKSFKKVSRGTYALKAGDSAAAPAKKPGRKPGRKPGKKPGKKPAAAKKPAVKAAKTVKRKKYEQTADQFILGLVAGKGAATAAINKAWVSAGRTGRADNTLNKMVKAGKLKKQKVEGERGSVYTAA